MQVNCKYSSQAHMGIVWSVKMLWNKSTKLKPQRNSIYDVGESFIIKLIYFSLYTYFQIQIIKGDLFSIKPFNSFETNKGRILVCFFWDRKTTL